MKTKSLVPTIAMALITSSWIASPEYVYAQATSAATEATPVVSVAEARQSGVVARTAVSGTVVATEEVFVNTRINGYAIESISADIGDRVEAGDVLAILDDAGPTAQLAQAEAELIRSEASIGQAQSQIDAATASTTESNSSLKRIQTLSNSGNISKSALDQARAASATAQANLASARNGLSVAVAQQAAASSQFDLAQLTLNRTKILAPVSGVISARSATLGDIANGGTEPLFRIIRDGQLEIVVDVVESGMAGIHIADRAEFRVSSVGDVIGEIRLIAPTVDPRTRLGKVYISLPSMPELKAGLSASGWLLTAERNVVTVPSSAVLTDGITSSVSKVVDSTIVKVDVVAGVLTSEGRREIISGIEAGDKVVAKAGAFFIDGDVVRAVEMAPATNVEIVK